MDQRSATLADQPGASHDRRQIERAREAPSPSDALPQYGGHGYVPAEHAHVPEDLAEVPPLSIDVIAGVVLDSSDFSRTRDFYARIFRDASGEWTEKGRSLVFSSRGQRVEFVKRSRPRTIAHAGQHVGYRVRPQHVRELADELAAAGYAVHWWREDHPSERSTTAYVKDSSGNVAQLVPSDDEELLVDHYYVPVEDIEHAELFYLNALSGEIQSYFGYTTEQVLEARAWEKGDDPCAPWTRNAFMSFRTHAPNPTPAAQIFARFGPTYIGVTLSGQRLPEPAEELLKWTPRAILRTSQPPAQVAAHLARLRISPVSLKYEGGKVPFKREGHSAFLRDRSGNFFQIDATG